MRLSTRSLDLIPLRASGKTACIYVALCSGKTACIYAALFVLSAKGAPLRACGAMNRTSLIHAIPSTNTSEAIDAIRPMNAASPKEIRKRCGE